MEDGTEAVGLFNRGEETGVVAVKLSELGLTGSQTPRDLWRQQDLPPCRDEFRATVPRHGVVLVRFRPVH